jgi:hypothetical protein
MIPSYINPSHVSEEYELRLHDRARNVGVQSVPRESVMHQRLGRLIIGLGQFVYRHRPSTVSEPADGRWVTKGS